MFLDLRFYEKGKDKGMNKDKGQRVYPYSGCESSKGGSYGTNGGSWLVESDHVTRGWRHIISGVGNRWPVDKKDRGLMEPEVTWFRRETADQWIKRIAGSWNRKSRGLEGKPLTSGKNGSWAQGEGKPRRKRGLKSPKSKLGKRG